MIRTNADLFRLANMCASKEETRYYLNGVLIEPHAVKGVILVATDGHRMVVIHDETGHADESAIVHLSPEALKACKPGRNERRLLEVTDIAPGKGSAWIKVSRQFPKYDNTWSEPELTAVSANCVVDGTFPHWQRVLPKITEERTAPSFNTGYLASFTEIGEGLNAAFNPDAPRSKEGLRMVITASDAGGPALVTWPGYAASTGVAGRAFGVLMPMRFDDANAHRIPPFVETATAHLTAAA
jgi:hypothetical protein